MKPGLKPMLNSRVDYALNRLLHTFMYLSVTNWLFNGLIRSGGVALADQENTKVLK